MAGYCSKITEHISKITERYIKMAYSKHKMTEYRDDSGLGAAVRRIGGLVNVGSAHRSMRDESEVRAGARVGGERMRAGQWGMHERRVGGTCMVGGAWGWLDWFVGWLV
jgi:hypothetical protein